MCDFPHICVDVGTTCAKHGLQGHTCWPNRCLHRHTMPWQKQRDATRPKLLKLKCWKCHRRGNRTWGGTTELHPPPLPKPNIYPSHKKKHWSHRALQLYVSLNSVSVLTVSYRNPRLLHSRNLTVRNLRARRLKPEECHCSGHSCTSTGLATAATVWLCVCVWKRGGGGKGRRARRSRRCEKGNFNAFPVASWQSSTELTASWHIPAGRKRSPTSQLPPPSSLSGCSALGRSDTVDVHCTHAPLHLTLCRDEEDERGKVHMKQYLHGVMTTENKHVVHSTRWTPGLSQ